MIKVLVCAGDSHAWGQGASGAWEAFDPPPVAGDLRPVPFRYGGYVTLLRRLVCRATGSSFDEYDAASLARAHGLTMRGACAQIGGKTLRLGFRDGLVRLFFASSRSPSAVTVTTEGRKKLTLDLRREQTGNVFPSAALFTGQSDGLTVGGEGDALLYRAECYRGPWAVVNAGVGSCPAGRYLRDYWSIYVSPCRPAAVLIEPFAINDWLAGTAAEDYRAALREMFLRCRAGGAAPVLLTVSPIDGPQAAPFGKTDYRSYLDAGAAEAKSCGVPIADANTIMRAALDGLSQAERHTLLFHDNWHVNDFGQRIYARAAFDTLLRLRLIEGADALTDDEIKGEIGYEVCKDGSNDGRQPAL